MAQTTSTHHAQANKSYTLTCTSPIFSGFSFCLTLFYLTCLVFLQHFQFLDWLFLLVMPHLVSFPDAISLQFKNIAPSSVPCSVSSEKHLCSYLQLLKWWFFKSPSASFPYIMCNISHISTNEMKRVTSTFSL